jgi:hypothetical protein
MARLASEFVFTGSMGNVSAYTMKGSNKIIVRTKGGASKEKIKSSAAFANTRRINAEFGGRATASRWVMQALLPHKPLADYNIAGPINALLKPIQELDDQGKWGERHVLLSKNPHLLKGFSFNQNSVFDSVVRTSLDCTLSREQCRARIEVPALVPNINLFASQRYPLYSITAVLGMVPDLFYSASGYRPSLPAYDNVRPTEQSSEWYPVQEGSPAFALELSVAPPPDAAFTLVLSIGICYGAMLTPTRIEQAPFVGSARVIAVG